MCVNFGSVFMFVLSVPCLLCAFEFFVELFELIDGFFGEELLVISGELHSIVVFDKTHVVRPIFINENLFDLIFRELLDSCEIIFLSEEF